MITFCLIYGIFKWTTETILKKMENIAPVVEYEPLQTPAKWY